MADTNLISALAGLAQGLSRAYQAKQARKFALEDYDRQQQARRDELRNQALIEAAGMGSEIAGQRADVLSGLALDRNDPNFGSLVRNRPNLMQAIQPQGASQTNISNNLSGLRNLGSGMSSPAYNPRYGKLLRNRSSALQSDNLAGIESAGRAMSLPEHNPSFGEFLRNRQDLAQTQDIAPTPPAPVVTSGDDLSNLGERATGVPLSERSTSAIYGPFEDLAKLRKEKDARDKELAREKMQEEIRRIKSQTQANESRVTVQKSLDKLNRARAALIAAQRTGRTKDERLNALNKTHEAVFDALRRVDDYLNIEGLSAEEEALYSAEAEKLRQMDEEILEEMQEFSGVGKENETGNGPRAADSRAVDFYRTLVKRLTKDLTKNSRLIGAEPQEMEEIKRRAREMTLARYPEIDENLLTLPNEIQHQEPMVPEPRVAPQAATPQPSVAPQVTAPQVAPQDLSNMSDEELLRILGGQ